MLISILKFLILCYDRLYESHKVFVSFYELWGIMKQKEYYTAGELARLFNIPKQTMLYYDKTGVLQPEFIAENGYRYYATPQYLTLEIILFLRKMDISVPDIRNFLQHKSREEILKVIAKRENECRQQIQEAEMLMHSLGNYREALEKSRSLPLNQVLLESCSDCRMYLTPIPKSQRGGLSAITIRARHVREAFSHCYCKEKPTGWVISRWASFTAASAIPLRWSRNQDRPVPVSPAITSVLPDFILLSILRAPISIMARIRWNECRILWIKTISSLTEMYSFSPSSAIGSPITPKSISTPSA